MSWSAQYTYNGDGPFNLSGTTPMTKEHNEQLHVALTTVKDLIDSGVVGDETKKFSVTISGHANPNHEPAAGWANDALTIAIVQID